MISADWSRSGLNEREQDYGATTVFYPTDGSSPIMVLMGDRTYKTVHLKEGRYDVVLFNRSFGDFGNLGFRGEDAYRTLEAHATNVVTKDAPSTEIIITDSPDDAYIVSKARLDLPEPDRPVSTTRLSLGISTSIFLRLCSLAPLILI